MKRHRIAHLSVLMIGFAISSPKMMSQVAPSVVLASVDTPVVSPPSRLYAPHPISAYRRSTQREKLRLFEFDAFGPYAFGKAVLAAGFQQASNAPPEWDGGAKHFGERVASNFGIQLVTTTTRYGMGKVLHEDAVYYPCGCGGFFHGFRHAVISTVTARHGVDGHTAFSVSGLASPYAGTMTALAWYPERYGPKDGFRMGNYDLAIRAVENLALEFVYGGPHSMFSHIGGFKSPGETVADQNP